MHVKRGDVILAVFPFADGSSPKKRPVMVVQSDAYNLSMRNASVAEITSNTSRAADPAHVWIDIATPDGQATGLLTNSLVSGINLATLNESRLEKVIGAFSLSLMKRVDACLKIALELSP